MALGKEFVASIDVVAVDDLDVSDALDRGADSEEVIIDRGFLVFATEINDDKKESGILDVSIRDTSLTEKFRAGLLEIDEELGVVQEAHAVGLGVADADGGFVGLGHGEVQRECVRDGLRRPIGASLRHSTHSTISALIETHFVRRLGFGLPTAMVFGQAFADFSTRLSPGAVTTSLG